MDEGGDDRGGQGRLRWSREEAARDGEMRKESVASAGEGGHGRRRQLAVGGGRRLGGREREERDRGRCGLAM